LSSKGYRPHCFGAGEDYHLEEFINNTGMLPTNLVTSETMLQQVAKSIAVLHHDEDIKAYLRTKDPSTNKIMSDGTEDLIKAFKEQNIMETFYSHVENPESKELADEFIKKREEGLDDLVRKFYVDVKSSVLGEVAAHRDCHNANWIMPEDSPEKPILVDYEDARIEFAGIDLGIHFISGGWKDIYNQQQRRNFLKYYLLIYYEQFKKDKTGTFEEYFNKVID
jgi:hypothetical protein